MEITVLIMLLVLSKILFWFTFGCGVYVITKYIINKYGKEQKYIKPNSGRSI